MAELKRRKVIMDIDTGSDDAVAIIAAMMSPEFEVMGLCTVNGNREVKLTTLNTLRVAELLNSNVPVYKGCEYPMVATLAPGRKPNIPWREGEMAKINPLLNLIHGDHLPLPGPTWKKEEDMDAVSFYIDALVHAEEKVTLIPVGPLTNIAMAMRCDSRICENIEEIMIMGGGYLVNNAGAGFAEYNIWVDPEAGEIVMQYAEEYGIKVTWVPLDATHDAYLTLEDAAEIRKIGSPVANAVASFVEQRTSGYSKDDDMKELGGAPIHDLLAVLALLDPDVLVDVQHVNLHVDYAGGRTDGMTCLDMRELTDKPAPNCYFAMHANREKFRDMLLAILKRNEVYSK